MARDSWEARSRTGAQQKGVMEANTRTLVEAQLKKFGFSNITIKEEGKGFEDRREAHRLLGSNRVP